MADSVEVAVGGSIDRHDKCAQCDRSMLYQMNSATGLVRFLFCGAFACKAFLLEIADD